MIKPEEKELEEIKNRLERGYTMAIYGDRKNIYMQMYSDIMALVDLYEKKQL